MFNPCKPYTCSLYTDFRKFCESFDNLSLFRTPGHEAIRFRTMPDGSFFPFTTEEEGPKERRYNLKRKFTDSWFKNNVATRVVDFILANHRIFSECLSIARLREEEMCITNLAEQFRKVFPTKKKEIETLQSLGNEIRERLDSHSREQKRQQEKKQEREKIIQQNIEQMYRNREIQRKMEREKQKPIIEKIQEIQLEHTRTQIEKISECINALEKETGDFEEKLSSSKKGLYEEKYPDIYRGLQKAIIQNKQLKEKIDVELKIWKQNDSSLTAVEKLEEDLQTGLPFEYKVAHQTVLKQKQELGDLQARISELDERLSEPKTALEGYMPKVLLKCRDGSVTAFSDMLKEIPFFSAKKNCLEMGMDQASQSKELSLESYSRKAIQQFVDFCHTGLFTTDDMSTLKELYELADYIGDEKFLSQLADTIDTMFSDIQMLQLLVESTYNQTGHKDAVSEKAFERVLQKLTYLRYQPDFSKLRSRVLHEILTKIFETQRLEDAEKRD